MSRKLSLNRVFAFLVSFFVCNVVMAQGNFAETHNEPGDTVAKKLDCRITLEGGVGSWFGQGYAYTGLVPEIRYHFNDRFSLSAGVRLLNGFSLSRSYNLQGNKQSLVPRRGGAKLVEAYVAGEFQVNERLWLAASLLHIGGEMDFMPFHGAGSKYLSANVFSADIRYRTRRGSLLGIHVSYIDDRGGLLAPWYYDPYMDGFFSYGEEIGFGGGFGFGAGRGFGFY